jgi:hypothetical protein
MLIALLLAGCTTQRSTSISLEEDGGLVVSGATGLPELHLELDGVAVAGLLNAFSWTNEQDGTIIGGENLIPIPPGSPATLTAQVGQVVEIVLPAALTIPILTITERIADGSPIRTLVLKPEDHRHSYALDSERLALLDVTAQWPNLDFVTYRFQVDIQR